METSEVTIPTFSSEAEEAEWWFKHQDVLLQQFKQAASDGRLGRGTAMRRAQSAVTPTTTIRLDRADISKARAVAAKRGLKYQTYLKMLIHEALSREPDAA